MRRQHLTNVKETGLISTETGLNKKRTSGYAHHRTGHTARAAVRLGPRVPLKTKQITTTRGDETSAIDPSP